MPDKIAALLEELAPREACSKPIAHNDNEADDALLMQRALGYVLRLSFEKVVSEPLSSEIALLLVWLALAESIRSSNESAASAL